MSQSIFEKSTQGKLSDVFGAMTTRSAPKTVVEESTAAPVETTPAPVAEVVVESDAPVVTPKTLVGTRFDEVYNSIFSEEAELDVSIDGDIDLEGGDEYEEEGEMVQVPKAILKELLAYMEDTMGDEDSSDYELPMEGADYTVAKNQMGNTTKTGSDKQSNKTGTSASKTGQATDKKESRTGSVSFLKNLLSCYVAKGNTKQANKLSVGDQPVVK
jgi:hypothetical protein